ncbi:acyl-CoA thioesterase [Sporobolomyces koalae]|uniref:acyl-CoA thioesterase n=1 Tax=Sporobolomyces koalae TaxID=500713 RepID=UPI00316D45BC
MLRESSARPLLWAALGAVLARYLPYLGLAISAASLVSSFLNTARHQAMQSPERTQAKGAGASLVSYRYKIAPPECDHHGRLFGGELLKLIDVSAGLIAARHCGGPCLTISVDRVIFLQEVKVGDVIHISSAVNRAWGSSMEIGVRVMKENVKDPLNPETYCCHAYLTFVAKPTLPPPAGPILAMADFIGMTIPPKPKRAQLPAVTPSTLLEQKRYLLAGRRRAHRIKNAKETDALLSSYRSFVDDLESRRRLEAQAPSPNEDELVQQLQEEILLEAYMRGDPDVRVDGHEVVGSIEGYMSEVRVSKSVLEKAAIKRGHGGWVKIPLPDEEVVSRNVGHSTTFAGSGTKEKSPVVPMTIDFADTLCMCLWIVRPQHCNSKNILFGGTLMRWVEEVSSIAARRISPHAAWSSAAIDGLTFKLAVEPGWVVYCRAAVVKVWDSSIEVAVTVTCEDRNSATPRIRPVSDSLFTLVAIDPLNGRPLRGSLRQVRVPEGPASEIASGSDKRREDRLLDKRVLQQVYA